MRPRAARLLLRMAGSGFPHANRNPLIHRLGAGWSRSAVTKLDSERTLVVAFWRFAVRRASGSSGRARRGVSPKRRRGLLERRGDSRATPIADGTLVVAVAIRPNRLGRRLHRHRIRGRLRSGRRTASAGASPTPGRRLVLVLSEGLTVNGTDLVRGLSEALPRESMHRRRPRGRRRPLRPNLGPGRWQAGRSPGGRSRPPRPLEIGAGSQSGWEAFGPERKVTRADGNVLDQLDGRPGALALYKEYLGKLATGLPATALRFPLSIREERGGGAKSAVVRSVLAIDEAAQSMTFAGDVPIGWRAAADALEPRPAHRWRNARGRRSHRRDER